MFGLKGQLKGLRRKDVPAAALERQRARLVVHMIRRPMRAPASVPPSALPFGLKPALAVLVAFTVLSSTGGVVMAAQDALPGETLYPVKIASEEMRAGLTLSADAKFRYRSVLAERRLEEVESLYRNQEEKDERDRMVAVAMRRYERHVDRLNGLAERFEEKGRPKDPDVTIEAVGRVLGTHARLLASATATDEQASAAVAAYAKGTVELEDRLMRRFDGREPFGADTEKRKRFERDMASLKTSIKRAERFRAATAAEAGAGTLPVRDRWPRSWWEEHEEGAHDEAREDDGHAESEESEEANAPVRDSAGTGLEIRF